MSKLARYQPSSASRLLRHVLERPDLVLEVRELRPADLGKLIDFVGLEGASELVALATTEQLERVFDEDLWVSESPGSDPHFDARRFAVWLEVLLEAGEEAVIGRLLELPEDFVTLAVARSMLVVDIDALGIALSDASDELEPIEKALESLACEEWEEFRLIARDQGVFELLVSVLMALDREHHGFLRRILERCAAISQEFIADNGGLYEVLTSDEMLEADARGARDERRAAIGHVAPSDAKSFLEYARQGLGDPAVRDPVTRAYFRELVRKEEPSTERNELARLLARATAGEKAKPFQAGSRKSRKRLMGSASQALVAKPPSLLEAALGELRERAPSAYAERMEELAYLSNALVAAHAPNGRRLRPIEALELAITTCHRGLDATLAASGKAVRPEMALEVVSGTTLDLLFRRAWPRIKDSYSSESRSSSRGSGARERW
jgi:hypothetical protein